MRTVAAHDQFVNCMVWGRMAPAITDRPDGASVNKTVNVLATGGADKVSKPSSVDVSQRAQMFSHFRLAC
jgi:hypothetical protein